MDFKLDNFLKRFDEKLLQKGLTDRQISLMINGKPDVIRSIRRGRHPRLDIIFKIANILDVSCAWLIGEEKNCDNDNISIRELSLTSIEKLYNCFINNNLIDLPVAFSWSIPKYFINNASNINDNIIIKMKSDNMMPTIYPGDLVLVQLNSVLESGIFVIIDKKRLFLRRIDTQVDNINIINLYNDNRQYIDQNCKLDDLLIIGRVISCFKSCNNY